MTTRVSSERDRSITVYGRMPVLEALRDDSLAVTRVVLARGAHGPTVDEIVREATRRRLRPERLAPEVVTRISGNGRHDQGVVARVTAARMRPLDSWLEDMAESETPQSDGAKADGSASHAVAGSAVLVLDGVTNPANVGLVIRSAVGAGMAGVVLPRAGCPDVGPLVIKASAGVAFDAPILRAATAAAALEALAASGFRLYGLAAPSAASPARSLFDPDGFARRSAFVVGNETSGLSPAATELVHEWVSIPLAGQVESLNVAVAAGVVCFELLRRRLVG